MGAGASRYHARNASHTPNISDADAAVSSWPLNSARARVRIDELHGDELLRALQTRKAESTKPLRASMNIVMRHVRSLAACFGFAPDLSEYQPHVNFLQAVSSPHTSLEQYAQLIINEVMRVLGADRCSLFFVDKIRGELWCVGSLDMNSFSMPADQGIVGLVAQQGKLINLVDAHEHDAFDPTVEEKTGYHVKSLLSLPIKHITDPNTTIGVIQVLNKIGDHGACFTEPDVLELQKIAMLINDSFHRQRWNALESCPSHGDQEALAVIAAHGPSMSTASSDPISEILSFHSEASTRFERTLEIVDGRLANFYSLDLDVLHKDPQELARLVSSVMQHTKCAENCNVFPARLDRWAHAARRLYRNNPYHNWFHAFSVFHICSYQIQISNVFNMLRSLDVFGLLVAALCHDVDHPGFTNTFLVESQSDLALRYNDVSVLENHHAFLACELLRNEETAIGAGMDRPRQQVLRQTVITCILSTDMTRHTEMCHKLVTTQGSTGFDANNPGDKQLLLNSCIHAADLSSQVLPWNLAMQWEERISTEFVNQAAEELAAGRTPAPYMSFRLDDAKHRGKLQRDFIDFVLVPLWDPYTHLVPEIKHCYGNLISNRGFYDHRCVHGYDRDCPGDQIRITR